MPRDSWNKTEKKHARVLFDRALDREYQELISEINALHITSRDEVWELLDRLEKKAKEMDRIYDYRYSQLIYVFAQLVHRGYLSRDELNELGEEKAASIKQLLDSAQ
jgi:hypothetical protein